MSPILDRTQASRLAATAAATVTVGGLLAVAETSLRHEPSPLLVLALTAVLAGCAMLLIVVPIRTSILRGQAEAMARQEAVLDATAFAAERLVSTGPMDERLADVLERIGLATGANRVCTFRNGIDAAGRLTMSVMHEWTTPGIRPILADPKNRDYPYDRGFSHWREALGAGAPVQMTRTCASGEERDDMEAEGAFSVLAVPVLAGDSWWGFISFDDCERERTWSHGDLDALRATGVTLGAAMAAEEAAHAMREAKDRYQALVEHLPVAVYLDGLDDTASTIYMSPVIETMVGYSVKEWEDDPDLFPKLLHPEDREATLAATAHHNATGEPFSMEYRLLAKDGGIVWIHDEAVLIRDADGTPLYSQGIMQDVTAAKAAEEQISYLSYHDPLTGLANQAMFAAVTDLALARARRVGSAVALLFLDLDAFKLVNDSLGAEGGDRLLRMVADRLSEAIRDTDTLARRGGDEFLFLLPDLEPGQLEDMPAPLLYAETVAGRIREKLSEPFDVDGAEIFISASVGISVGPEDADDVVGLLSLAEAAMFESKRSGPGGFVASQMRTAETQTKLEFVTKLRKAVARKEWVLHYQPIVELATGGIMGVEALVRWQTGDGEMIPPNEFIPLAEELGLIETIGDWVVEELVRQDEAWRRQGIDLEMGFNLSPRQFWQEDLAERILDRLDAKRVNPSRVVVEITETSAMRDPDRAQLVLTDLHSRGLRVAIDDFGTGYSSLSRLRALPIDVLKIDRSFVSNVDKDPQAARIVAAFIQLGQGLGMTTLAEGIETEEEWRFLVREGCELGQGYHFCRPLPADALTERFRAGELLVIDGS